MHGAVRCLENPEPRWLCPLHPRHVDACLTYEEGSQAFARCIVVAAFVERMAIRNAPGDKGRGKTNDETEVRETRID
jgi:hypothetical protein